MAHDLSHKTVFYYMKQDVIDNNLPPKIQIHQRSTEKHVTFSRGAYYSSTDLSIARPMKTFC